MQRTKTKNQSENASSKMPNLSTLEEVRNAIIASEILQRKW